jgi:hypothetical protein
MRARPELLSLLSDLCTDLGLCLPPEVCEQLASLERMDATEFAERVLRAEGLDPETSLGLLRQVKRKFIERFGSTI